MTKNKTLPIIIAVIIAAAAVSFGVYYFSMNKPDTTDIYGLTQPRQDSQSGEETPDDIPFKEFTSDDGKLVVKYPSTWVRSEIGDLSTVIPREFLNKYDIKLPLIVTLPEMGKLVQISVSRYKFSSSKTSDEILNELISDSEKYQDVKTAIISQKTNNSEIVFEAKYQKGNILLRSKEKLMFLATEDNIQLGYVVTFMTLERDWSQYQKIADHVIDSALLKK